MEVLGEDADRRPDLGKPGDDTSAVMATEPSTIEAPSADEEAGPPEDPADAGQLAPDPATPGFWRELGRRLRAEREAPQAAPPPVAARARRPVALAHRGQGAARRHAEAGAGQDPPATPRRRRGAGRRGRPPAAPAALGRVPGQGARRHRRPRRAGGRPHRPLPGRLPGRVTGARARPSPRSRPRAWTPSASAHAVDGQRRARDPRRRRRHRAGEPGAGRRARRLLRVRDTTIARITTYDAAEGRLQDTVPGFPPRNETGVAPGPARQRTRPPGDAARGPRHRRPHPLHRRRRAAGGGHPQRPQGLPPRGPAHRRDRPHLHRRRRLLPRAHHLDGGRPGQGPRAALRRGRAATGSPAPTPRSCRRARRPRPTWASSRSGSPRSPAGPSSRRSTPSSCPPGSCPTAWS